MESRSKEWLGRVWIFVVGAGLALSGAFFCWWLGAVWAKACAMDDWLEVEAKVLSSEVATARFNEFSQPQFAPLIRYRYEVAGRAFVGEQIRRVPLRSASADKAWKWVKRYPRGATVRAWIEPGHPGRAVLRRDSKAALYAIWFPAMFVLGGLGMSVKALCYRKGNGGGRGIPEKGLQTVHPKA